MLVYVVTCLLGAVLILLGYRPFVELFRYFSGTATPSLSGSQTATDLTLLVGTPALLAGGFALVTRVGAPARLRGAWEREIATSAETPRWLPPVIFGVCVAWAIFSLVRAGAADDVGVWFRYADWVAARQRAFAHIGFLSYTDIYLCLPVAAAWTLLSELRFRPATAPRSRWAIALAVRWLPVAITLGCGLLTFQKKAVVVSLVIICVTRIVHAPPHAIGRRRVYVWAAPVAIAAVYFATVLAPVIADAPARTGVDLKVANEVPAVVLYAALAPVTRTSAPALFYPVVYPARHPYYGIDLGQDVLGLGSSPDDNRVIWHFMNPTLPGTSAAPFQFSLYSQMGLVGALIGSFVLGGALAAIWRAARSHVWPREWSSLLATLTILLGVYLAIDSARNSVLVSYGIGWAFLFVLALFGLTQMLRPKPSTPTVANLSRTGLLMVVSLALGIFVGVIATHSSSSSSTQANTSQPSPPATYRASVDTSLARSTGDIRYWPFDGSLPSTWLAEPGVSVSGNGGTVRVVTNRRPLTYQLISGNVPVARGQYVVRVDAQAATGGIAVGVLDVRAQRFVASARGGSSSDAPGSFIVVRFEVRRATMLAFVLSGSESRRTGRRWTIRAVSVRRRPAVGRGGTLRSG